MISPYLERIEELQQKLTAAQGLAKTLAEIGLEKQEQLEIAVKALENIAEETGTPYSTIATEALKKILEEK